MATLLAITYPDADLAKKAMESINWSNFDHLIDVKASCWLTNENGELKVHPHGHHVADKAALGGALGLLVGGLFAIPVVGIAAGMAVGVHRGRHKELGIDEAFVTSVGNHLESGESALVMLYEEEADTAKAAMDLAQYGGTVHSSDLSAEQMARFQKVLDQQAHRDDAPTST
ncbi:MAG TPA: DUF1269 domain-containing protein [Thermomicrobiales bacterium]|nr:DUF1269 domain-containing protein [Thermomicrobiales bacterium]